MSPKVAHTKSRKGCKACKVRKVKCDEQRPVCGHCARLYNTSQCDYAELSAPNARQASVSSNFVSESSPVNATTTATRTTPTSSERTRDAGLLHHWYTTTSHSLPSHKDPANVDFWSNTVSIWASQHEFLLDAVLAISAMHMWSVDRQGRHDLQEVSMVLMNAAISKHGLAVAGINKNTAEPLLAATILTAFQAQVVMSFGAGTDAEPYHLPVDQLRFQLSIAAIYDLVRPFMTETSYLRKVNQLGTAMYSNGLPLNMLHTLRDETREDAEMLLGQIDKSTLHSGEAKHILRGTLLYLLGIEFGLLTHEPHEWTRRRLSTMPSRAPSGFLELVEQQDLLAMSVLARFYALGKAVNAGDPQWWFQGVAERQVTGIAGLFSRQSRWLMEGPLRRIAEI